ncbi:uncharacterized protein LOC143425252 [Xylocopa sonorina]|uniref:uncharacterized protein LOC143425252 n=1 Tax=Xylocopa sonorina TaxID=1818115 RepID=UPI00403AE214
MNIQADIQRITQIPQADDNPTFVRRSNPNIFRLKIRKPKPPRNANLYDQDDIDTDSQKYNEYVFNENEIASSIKEANCGITYANEDFERHWRNKHVKPITNSDDTASKQNVTLDAESSHETSLLKYDTNKRETFENNETILKKCGLHRNAVIRGLLRNHTISLSDLHIPKNCSNATDKHGTNVQNRDVSFSINTNEDNYIHLVPCPEDPEVLVQPLQAYNGIDESKCKHIDFTVPHIGKKKTVTPRQFFLDAEDSDFHFIKKDKTTE